MQISSSPLWAAIQKTLWFLFSYYLKTHNRHQPLRLEFFGYIYKNIPCIHIPISENILTSQSDAVSVQKMPSLFLIIVHFKKRKKINLLIIVELFRLYLIFSTNHVIRTEKYEECLHLAISSFIMYLPIFFSCRYNWSRRTLKG